MMRKSVDLVNKVAAPDEVMEAIHAVMHLWRAQRHRAGRDADDGVTHMESKALGFFARHPGATLSELVVHAGRDKGQLARLVNGLRERGLLAGTPDAGDRRSLRLHLTAAGQAADQAQRRQARRLAVAAVQGLDEAERSHLLALLRRVQANLEGDETA